MAAEHNLAAAQNNIAVLYEKGEGVPQDYVEAVRWYRLAAANGHKKANDAVRRLSNRAAMQPVGGGKGPGPLGVG